MRVLILRILYIDIFIKVSVVLILVTVGGAKGAMRGRGKGSKGRGGGSRGGANSYGEVDTFDNFGGGYGGKGRPCVGLCYLRSDARYQLEVLQ